MCQVAKEVGISEDDCFALMALKDIPEAYRAVVEHNLLAPEKR